MQQSFDVVIVGGGMVGASLAAALAPAAKAYGLSVAMIESQPMPEPSSGVFQPSYDARATALSFGTRKIFEQLGVWNALSSGVSPIRDIHVSERGNFGVSRLSAEQEGVPALGYVVENHWLGKTLTSHLSSAGAELTWLCPADVKAISPSSDGHTLRVRQGERQFEVTASLVVVADGGRSGLREQLGIGCSVEDYQQYALVTNVSLGQDHHGTAWERFTDQGPIAMLPLTPQHGYPRAGVVWTLPAECFESVSSLDDAEFLALLADRFGGRAGRFVAVGERYGYPLKLVRADEQVRKGLVVLGNAAHAMHPIAGQGFNLALRGAMALAERVIRAWSEHQNPGELSCLTRYQQQQMFDQNRTIGFSDRSMRLFSNSNPLLALGRGLGLQLLDLCPPAKTLFARAAMGIDLAAPDLRIKPRVNASQQEVEA